MARPTRLADPDRIAAIQRHLIDEPEARRLAAIFKALADPTRLALLHALSHAELSVGELATVVGMAESISAVSHHLRLLRSLNVVRDHREGKQIFYTIDDDHIASILQQSLEHIGHV